MRGVRNQKCRKIFEFWGIQTYVCGMLQQDGGGGGGRGGRGGRGGQPLQPHGCSATFEAVASLVTAKLFDKHQGNQEFGI